MNRPTPKFNYGDEVYFATGDDEIKKGTVIGLSYVDKIKDVIYLVETPLAMPKEDKDGKSPELPTSQQQPIQARAEQLSHSKKELITKLRDELVQALEAKVNKYNNMIKEL